MGSDDLTIRVLLEIRDNIQATNVRLDEFRAAVDARFEAVDGRFEAVDRRFATLGEEMGGRFDEVNARITAVELRMATQMTALIGSTRDLYAMLQDRFDLRERVECCERAIEDLDRRIG